MLTESGGWRRQPEGRVGKSSVRVEGTVDSNMTERFDHAEKEVSKKKFQVAGKSGHC